MISSPKITVIVPTRERISTLQWALKTCLAANADQYEILVSDNFSQDGTRDMVESLQDPRIRYVNTGKRVSMSHNWEFALNHVKEGYVSFLGDDDGLLPDTIDRVRSLIAETQLLAINGKAINYCWPNNIDPALRNFLSIPLKKGFTILDSSKALNDVVTGRRTYHDLPWLYGGFVSTKAIEQVKVKSGGAFFGSQIPDVYSGVSLTGVILNYVYSHEPLIINGISGHSTGAAQFNPDKNQQSQNTFATEGNIPFHKKFVFGPAIQVLIAECQQQAYDRGLIPAPPDIRAMLRQAAEESRIELATHQQKVKEALKEVAERNEILPSVVDELFTNLKAGNSLSKKIQLLNKYLTQKIAVTDATRWNISNVFEASQICYKLLRSRPNWGFLLSNLARFAASRLALSRRQLS